MQVFTRTTMTGWILPMSLVLCLLVVMFGGESAAKVLRYERIAVEQGEYWRLLTAHITHLGWSHMLLNLMGLLLLWVLVGHAMGQLSWWLLLIVCALSVSTGLWLFNPQLHWYVGLSGVLHGILLGGALLLACRGSREGIYLLLITASKLLWEQLVGPMPGSEGTAGGKVIVDAHLYGAIAGGVYALAYFSRRSYKAT